jgi:hypothetical protein
MTKELTRDEQRAADRKAEEEHQAGIAEKVAKSDAAYAKATITGTGADGNPTRSVPSNQ